jgi:hypothetical protein
MNINTEAQKDQAQLEREIDEQRAHIGDTISALEAQFSPGQMLDKFLSYGKTNGAEFSHNLVNTVRDNPVPTVLTALGVAWLMYGQSSRGASAHYGDASSASYGVDPDYEYHPSKAEELKEKAGHLKDSLKNNMNGVGQRVERTSAQWRHSASHAGQEIRARAGRASHTFQSLLHEQPLAIGAIGIAVGALIAASLPATSAEDRYLGEKRDKMAAKARQKIQEGKQKVSAMGDSPPQEQDGGSQNYGSSRAEYTAAPYAATSRYADNGDGSQKLNS